MKTRATRRLIEDMSETVRDYEELKAWWDNYNKTHIQKKKLIKKEEKKNVKVY